MTDIAGLEVEAGTAEQLRAQAVWAPVAAAAFWAEVWWDGADRVFRADVYKNGILVGGAEDADLSVLYRTLRLRYDSSKHPKSAPCMAH